MSKVTISSLGSFKKSYNGVIYLCLTYMRLKYMFLQGDKFQDKISKILFNLGSYEYLASLENKIRRCPLFIIVKKQCVTQINFGNLRYHCRLLLRVFHND